MSDLLFQVEGISKKYVRNWRRAMLYGLHDAARRTVGADCRRRELREHEFWALKDVTFEASPGECLGVIGRNGAGKSTLLKIISGIIRPDAGCVRLAGRVGALIEVGAGFHPELSGRENIYLNGSLLGLSRREIEKNLESIVHFSGLEAVVLDALVKTYSSGMHARLGFAIAIHAKPRILLVDEALSVGDMSFQGRCATAISKLQHDGTAFVLVTHDLDLIAEWAGRAIALDQGRVIASGPSRETIMRYVERLGSIDSKGDTSTDGVGTGRVQILETCVQNSRGEPAQSVLAGETLTLLIDVRAREPVHDMEVEVKCWNERGELLAGSSNWAKPFALTAEAAQVRVAYPPLPINRGWVRMSISLWRNQREELMDAVDFRGVGVVGGEWVAGELCWTPTFAIHEVAEPELVAVGDLRALGQQHR